MTAADDLDGFRILDGRATLSIIWPVPGNPSGYLHFEEANQWYAFVDSLGLGEHVPQIVRAKHGRAQLLYRLGWIDGGLIKAGELAALIALELALKDRYGRIVEPRPGKVRSLARLLNHLVDVKKLSDQLIPMIARCGGTAVGQLTGKTEPSLSDIRNGLAHGDPFEGFPVAGLLELTRDLIHFAYREP